MAAMQACFENNHPARTAPGAEAERPAMLSCEKREVCRTLTATQVSGRNNLGVPDCDSREDFSSHLWFFGPQPVSRILTGRPGGPDARSRSPNAGPAHAGE